MLFGGPSHRRADPLRRCPHCRSHLVGPLAWRPSDDAHWSIDMRCGECEHEWHAVVGDRRAARFDVELNADIAVLERSLRRLELQRMSVELEAFAAALARDLILPADFDR